MAHIPTRPGRSGSISSRQTGAHYETKARQHLENEGLTFIAANVTLHKGEIDLIMHDRETLVFVEVRYRRNANFGDAATSITSRKRQKLRHTAESWLAMQGKSLDNTLCRFDVLAITGNQLQWLPNAFGADDF